MTEPDEREGWRLVLRAGWGSAAVASLLSAVVLPAIEARRLVTLVAMIGVVAALAAALAVRRQGRTVRPRRRPPNSPALLGIAAAGGATIGLGFGLVVVATVSLDLPAAVGIAGVCVVGAIGTELLLGLLLRLGTTRAADEATGVELDA